MKTRTASSLFLVAIASFSCIFNGCVLRRVHEEDLVGKYQADLPDGTVEWLNLLPEGECFQQIRLIDGSIYKARGRWRYFESTKYLQLQGTRVALTATRARNPNIAQISPGITGALPVSRTLLGEVTIMLNVGIDYRKQ